MIGNLDCKLLACKTCLKCLSKAIHKPRANGRNITCCARLHTLLHVAAQSLKPVKLLANGRNNVEQ